MLNRTSIRNGYDFMLKRLFFLLVSFILFFSFVACTISEESNSSNSSNPAGSITSNESGSDSETSSEPTGSQIDSSESSSQINSSSHSSTQISSSESSTASSQVTSSQVSSKPTSEDPSSSTSSIPQSSSIPLSSSWIEILNTVKGEGVGKLAVDKNGAIRFDNESGGFMSSVAAVYNEKVKINGLELCLNIKNLFSDDETVWLPHNLASTVTVSLSSDKPTSLVSFDHNDSIADKKMHVNPMAGNKTGLNTKIKTTAACVFTLVDSKTDYGIFGGMSSALKVSFHEIVRTAVRSGSDFTLKFALSGNTVKILINGVDIGVSFSAADVCDEDGYAYLSFTSVSFGAAHSDFSIKSVNGQAANSFVPKAEPKTFAEAIAQGYSFKAELTTIKNFGTKTIGGELFKSAQGIASDGTYLYFILKLQPDAASVIVKTTLKGKEVAVSNKFDLGHANDMTYDSISNCLIVAHGSSSKNTANGNDNGRRLSFIDPDTLKLKYTQADILPSGYAAGAIAYDATNNRFILSRGGKSFRIVSVSSKYTVTGISNGSRVERSVEGSENYTAQGMGCDGKYVYFPMSGNKNNIIVVYTLSGSYVTTFTLPTSMESESISFVNGKMYICFNNNGAVIARVDFTLQ